MHFDAKRAKRAYRMRSKSSSFRVDRANSCFRLVTTTSRSKYGSAMARILREVADNAAMLLASTA